MAMTVSLLISKLQLMNPSDTVIVGAHVEGSTVYSITDVVPSYTDEADILLVLKN